MNKLGHVSHSQIEMFLRCPRQWEFRYVKGLVIPPGGALVLGGSYHKALEVNFLHKLRNGTDMQVDDCLDCFSDAWDTEVSEWEGRGQEVEWGGDQPGLLKTTGIKLVQAYRLNVAPSVVPVSVERTYSLDIDGTPFIGALDLEAQHVDVIDHKTSRDSYSQAEVDRALQPSAHAFALGRELKYEIHVAVKTTGRIQKVRTHRTLDDVVWWLDLAFTVIRSMRTGLAPPNPNGWWHSPKYCGYYRLCMGTT